VSSWWQRQSFKLRLTLWYACVITLVLALFAFAVYEVVEHRLAAELDRQLRIDFDLVEGQLDLDKDGRVLWLVRGAHGDGGFARLFAWFEVWSEEGELLLRHWPIAESEIKHPLPAPATTTLQFRDYQFDNDLPVRLMERPARLRHRGVVLRMFRDQSSMQQTLRQIIEVFAITLPFSVAVASVGGYLLARRSLAPVGAMASQARSITSDSLEARLPNPNPHDEFGQLAAIINATLARLESSFHELKRFTADASHELRTPLTALRSVGEVALRRPDDPASHRIAIESMLEEAERLSELTDALLTLARTESAPMPQPAQPVIVGEVVRDVVLSLSDVAIDKQQKLDVTGDTDALAVGDRRLLRQALMNIVHNAIRYSPANTSILLRVQRRIDDVTVEVVDEGPGIPEAYRAKVFERFFRVDSSRARAEGGHGLGLAIAKASVERQGGRIELDSDLTRGSTFRVTLPVAHVDHEP
jgi:heavy metal sensor kinase